MNVWVSLLQYDGFYCFLLYAKRRCTWLSVNTAPPSLPLIVEEQTTEWIDVLPVELGAPPSSSLAPASAPSTGLVALKSTWFQRYLYYAAIAILLWHWQLVVWRDTAHYAWFFALPPIVDAAVQSSWFQRTYQRSQLYARDRLFEVGCDTVSAVINVANRELLGIHSYISPDDIAYVCPHWSRERCVDLVRVAALGLFYDYLNQCWNWIRFQRLSEDTLRLYRHEIEAVLHEKQMDRLATPRVFGRLVALYNHTDHQYVYQRAQRHVRRLLEHVLRWSTYWSLCSFLEQRWHHAPNVPMCLPLLCTYAVLCGFEFRHRVAGKQEQWVRMALELALGCWLLQPGVVLLVWLHAPAAVYDSMAALCESAWTRSRALLYTNQTWIAELLNSEERSWYECWHLLSTRARIAVAYIGVWILWCAADTQHCLTILLLHLVYALLYKTYHERWLTRTVELPTPIANYMPHAQAPHDTGSAAGDLEEYLLSSSSSDDEEEDEWTVNTRRRVPLRTRPQHQATVSLRDTARATIDVQRMFIAPTQNLFHFLRDSYYGVRHRDTSE